MTEKEMRSFLGRIEREFAPEVDLVILKYAKTGRWPPNSSEHAYFLARRIEFAFWILSIMSMPIFLDKLQFDPVPDPTAPPTIIIQWLLKDAWEIFGRSQWIDHFLSDMSK